MKLSTLAIAGCLLLASHCLSTVPVHAKAKPGEEQWIAQSTTAYSITGDIRLSPTRLRMAGTNMPLKVVADLQNYRASDDRLVPARLLEVVVPKNVNLLNGNRFGCGESIRWIVVWRFDGGKQLGMDTYEGAMRPQSEGSSQTENKLPMAYRTENPGFCGSYYYVRPPRG